MCNLDTQLGKLRRASNDQITRSLLSLLSWVGRVVYLTVLSIVGSTYWVLWSCASTWSYSKRVSQILPGWNQSHNRLSQEPLFAIGVSTRDSCVQAHYPQFMRLFLEVVAFLFFMLWGLVQVVPAGVEAYRLASFCVTLWFWSVALIWPAISSRGVAMNQVCPGCSQNETLVFFPEVLSILYLVIVARKGIRTLSLSASVLM